MAMHVAEAEVTAKKAQEEVKRHYKLCHFTHGTIKPMNQIME